MVNSSSLILLSRCLPAANLVLQGPVERIYVGHAYGDLERGIYLIRGENVILLGEIVRGPHRSLRIAREFAPPARVEWHLFSHGWL